MEADEEAVPIPHLRVVSGGNEVGVLDVAVGGADGLGREACEIGGEIVEEGGGVGLVGWGLGLAGSCEKSAEQKWIQNRTEES